MTMSSRNSRRENQPTPELRGVFPPEPSGDGRSGPPGTRLGGPLSLFLSASATAGASGARPPCPRCRRVLRSQSCVNILKGTCFLARGAPARPVLQRHLPAVSHQIRCSARITENYIKTPSHMQYDGTRCQVAYSEQWLFV